MLCCVYPPILPSQLSTSFFLSYCVRCLRFSIERLIFILERIWHAQIFRIRLICNVSGQARSGPNYYGRKIGALRSYAYNISGIVYAVDDSTIFIKNFCYGGTGPAAYFWVGNTPRPSPEGYIVPYPEDHNERCVFLTPRFRGSILYRSWKTQ